MANTFRILACVAALLGSLPARAQGLPEGEHHANRTRTYDIRHYRADLRFDLAHRSIRGHATIELAPLGPLRTIALDAIGLEVSEVLVDGNAADYKTTGRQLGIRLAQEAPEDRPMTVEIRYEARPKAGMYFQADPGDTERSIISTYGEGGLLANWLPIYNDVNDKFSTEMIVTVPTPYKVVSNGVLAEETVDRNEVTYHWKQDRPHANYLISLYIGDFERGELAPAFGRVPLAYWVPRGSLNEGRYAFRNTTRMVEFFSRRLGYEYPWDKYDQIAIPDYAIGAMEHTGVTGHNASVLRLEGRAPEDFGGPTFDEYSTDWTAEDTIAHELAHHWFGDNTTCRSLAQIWLNESFATYLQMLWAEEDQGVDQLLMDVELARRHYLDYVHHEHTIRPLEYSYFDKPDDIFNEEHTYLKGAAVLHMMRAVLGDEAFFRVMSHFLHKHQFDNVESADLKIAVEEATGQNLDWFFADWITGGGHPVFEVDSRWLEDRHQLDLHINQVQPLVEGQGLFRLPVVITIATQEKTWQETVRVEEAEEVFLLPLDAEPLMVSFDGAGSLVAEIRFDKEIDELVYQSANDALPGRLRALAQLASRFPTRDETRAAYAGILGNATLFWGLRAEAAQLLGRIRTPEALELAEQALRSPDYRVRKAAVLGSTGFGPPLADRLLRGVIATDEHPDVVGAAIVALARANPDAESEIFEQQLTRESWYDEIRIAALEAMKELKRKPLLPVIARYAAGPYNRAVREAGLEAWIATSPRDTALHHELIEAARGSVYSLQKFAIEQLGELYVSEATPLLEELVQRDIDANLTARAREALEEIERITGVTEAGGASASTR